MSTELSLRKLIDRHEKMLREVSQTPAYRKAKPEDRIADYATIGVKLTARSDVNDWVIHELVNHAKDILLVHDEALLNAFREFKNDLYKGISKDSFESVQSRLFSLREPLDSVYNEKQYKVVVLGYHVAQFNYKLPSLIAKHFPNTHFVLGLD